MNRTGLATLTLLLALALWFGTCALSSGHCAEPDSVGLHAGEPAPYDGILVPPGALRDLLADGDALDAEKRAHALDAEQAKADKAALEQRLQAAEASRRACEQDRAPPPRRVSWYERPGWVLAGGVLLGVGLAVGVVQAVR